MAEYMVGLWTNLTSDKVWRFWNSSNPIAGLTSRAGFLDNQPLHDLMSTLIEERGGKFKKRVLVSANDANTGSYVNFRLNDY